MECSNCGELIDAECQSFCHSCGMSAAMTRKYERLKNENNQLHKNISELHSNSELNFNLTMSNEKKLLWFENKTNQLSSENESMQRDINKYREHATQLEAIFKQQLKVNLGSFSDSINFILSNAEDELISAMRQLRDDVKDELSSIDDTIDGITIDIDF